MESFQGAVCAMLHPTGPCVETDKYRNVWTRKPWWYSGMTEQGDETTL
jgi:hypothetical protein